MSHEKHSWTTELTLDRFVRETGHNKHMLHLTVRHCVMLWVDVSANCPFQGFSGWELECGNWQALFMRAHIRKYHLRETKTLLSLAKMFWLPSGSAYETSTVCVGGDTVHLVHVVIMQLDVQVRYALGFLWSLLTTIFSIHPFDWIMSSP